MKQKIVLTGDRPTGPLHLGHYVGSLENRVVLQKDHKQFVMIADIQALTDNFDNPEKISQNIFEVACDYLAVGIDPTKTTIFIQSYIPQIAELTMFYLNLVSENRLKRNPTLKNEIQQKGYGENLTMGFLVYPVNQAADITFLRANLVPVGEDQLPIIEQTNEIVRAFNRIYDTDVMVEAEPIISHVARLPGTDGKNKMSKSLGNAIFLSDSSDEISKKVRSMYTDPEHLKISDPGKIEGNTVFAYLDVFDKDKAEVERLKEHYQKGGLGDVALKRRLTDILEALIGPIREKRREFHENRDYVYNILEAGTDYTKALAANRMNEIKTAMKINYFEHLR